MSLTNGTYATKSHANLPVMAVGIYLAFYRVSADHAKGEGLIWCRSYIRVRRERRCWLHYDVCTIIYACCSEAESLVCFIVYHAGWINK